MNLFSKFSRITVLVSMLILVGCAGEDGADGPQGPAGPPGADWPGPVPAAYTAADGLAGGAAYSQWYSKDGGGNDTLASYGVTVAADFIRCKACHGWDGVGSAGSYANRTGVSSGSASRPDVSDANLRRAVVSATYQELYDLVARQAGRTLNSASSGHPNYSAVLTESQVWNIVKFLREEFVNTNELYDLQISGAAMHYEWDGTAWVLRSPSVTYSDIGKNGNASNGRSIYNANCLDCHGTDGKTLPVGGLSGIGQFTRSKPNEAWFKVKFGQPPAMDPGLVTTTSDLKDLYKALADTVAFPN